MNIRKNFYRNVSYSMVSDGTETPCDQDYLVSGTTHESGERHTRAVSHDSWLALVRKTKIVREFVDVADNDVYRRRTIIYLR